MSDRLQEMSFLKWRNKTNGPAAGTFNAFLACAPGNEPALRGKIEQSQGLALSSHLNSIH